MPLFLFHLLEFMDVDWELDLETLQARWEEFDSWSQLVLKQTERRGRADHRGAGQRPVADGRGRLDRFIRTSTDWHTVGRDNEAFYLRVYGAGEYRYQGADIGVDGDARPDADRRPRS